MQRKQKLETSHLTSEGTVQKQGWAEGHEAWAKTWSLKGDVKVEEINRFYTFFAKNQPLMSIGMTDEGGNMLSTKR